MRRLAPPLLVAACLLTLVACCYGTALFRGGQFAYRDAAHFYYPLYQRVETEWDAGRWPLWEPEENAGMPLLGNPTAAVLYPGKLLYRVLPYRWGARLYVVAHTVLAFAAMVALLRSWGTGATGSALGGLAYAFGAPILFQYCNIIFLVGAAWTPLGFRAADRWLRLGRRWGLLELAVVLAMQTLGGDPESTYLTGVCAGGYAVALAWRRDRPELPRGWIWRLGLVGVIAAAVWTFGTIRLAEILPAYRPRHKLALAFPWMPWVPRGVLVAWGLAGLALFARWLQQGRRGRLPPMLAGLAAAAGLAGAIAAAQLLPVFEFTAQSGRAAGGGPHDIYPFSLEPDRIIEFVWPNIFGTPFHGNRSWLGVVDLLPVVRHPKVWVPSLYLGGLTLILALGAIGFRGGPPWRGWLSAIAVVSLAGSFGEYTGPLYWARWSPDVAAAVGPHDPADVAAIREDRQLRDGDGGVYWALATALPGFRQFRFPSKLLSFTAFALAGLAGIGWDRLMAGERRRPALIAATVLAVSLLALAGTWAMEDRIFAAFRGAGVARARSPFGPFDPPGAFAELRWALIQGAVVASAGLVLALRGGRRPGLAGIAALCITTADLALANASYVCTVPQRMLETRPKVIAIIEDAEKQAPSPRPYRVHRMPIWNPMAWFEHGSPDRVRDFVEWERDTIQPKYALPFGTQYTWTLGVAELYDYDWFFGGFLRAVDSHAARSLGTEEGKKIVVYPRRAFDLWNTRYFVIPAFPAGWTDEHRGFAAFLENVERIYPPPDAFGGPDGRERQREWVEREDLQVYRNRVAYPRAWVVHAARTTKQITDLDRADRERPMQELLFQDDWLWNDPTLQVFDPRTTVWVDEHKRGELILSGRTPSESEAVTVTEYTPQRVALEAELQSPGMVVLADVYYPGWKLTIDGKEAPVYRANRLMRGAAVPSGRHRLVYTFDPDSFRVGARLSLAGLTALAVLAVVIARRPVAPSLAASPTRNVGEDPMA